VSDVGLKNGILLTATYAKAKVANGIGWNVFGARRPGVLEPLMRKTK